MSSKVFLDTNILIYAYSNTEIDKREESRKLLANKEIVISTQVVNEFIWVMLRKFKVKYEVVNSIVVGLFNNYNVSIVRDETIFQAMTFLDRYKYTYWDSLMLSSSIENNCEIIYSEDMQHNQVIEDKLRIINPFNS